MKKQSAPHGQIPQETISYINQKAFAVSRMLGLGYQETEDLKQELMLGVWKRIGKFDPSKKMSLASYLHMRVDSVAANFIRDRNRIKRTSLLLVLDAPCGSAEEDGEDGVDGTMLDHIAAEGDPVRALQLKHDVAEILKKLDPKMRRVCEMLMAGDSIVEIARFLGCSRHNVYGSVFANLRNAFADVL